MALESATYIPDLNSSNPAPTDLIGQGDDHIRLVKAVLQATFPNLDGAVSLNAADFASLADLLAGSGGVPVGAITAWYGTSGAIPTGYHVCDGTLVPRSDGTGNIQTPDLRNVVIMGAGTVAAQGTTYGAANQTATSAAGGAHSHATTAGGGGHTHTGVAVGGTALTLSQIPSHSHGLKVYDRLDTDSLGSGGGGDNTVSSSSSFVSGYIDNAGSGATHTHSMSWPATPDGTHTHATDAAAAHTHGVTVPVYQPALALHYIMKV